MTRLALAALAFAGLAGLAALAAPAVEAQPQAPAPVVRKPVKPARPVKRKIVRVRKKPAPRPAPALDTCAVASDCTIYFRSAGCFPGDPLAVNTASLDAARKLYPQKRDMCAMGGPQWEKQKRMNDARWSVSCEAKRCVVQDHGLHDPWGDLLSPPR